MTSASTSQTTQHDVPQGVTLFLPGLDGLAARGDDMVRALEQLVRGRGESGTVRTAAIVLCHLRASRAPNDAAMTLLNALIEGVGPRTAMIDALASLGRARAMPLLRRALRMRRDEESVRELAAALLRVTYGGEAAANDALTLEQYLALSTVAQHPTLWTFRTDWLADHALPTTQEAFTARVAAGA